ncbi:MAG: ParB/RepB/Spo0J family partition protein [Oscillospiraceae bacterium]|nr:ParB/RepB/Spo0J family partition protein [Oscillospiraceae bacterium]
MAFNLGSSNNSGKLHISDFLNSGTQVQNTEKDIPIDQLVPWENQPFKMYGEFKMNELVESIKENGLLSRIIVCPIDGGKYRIIAGHNRVEACRRAGFTAVPSVIKNVDENRAKLIMADTNLCQRTELLPSERAFAYKAQQEALIALGSTRSTSDIADKYGENRKTIQRYIACTRLTPKLMELLDSGQLAMKAAVPLSGMPDSSQKEAAAYLGADPSRSISPSQAQILAERKFITESDIRAIVEGVTEKPETKPANSPVIQPVTRAESKQPENSDEPQPDSRPETPQVSTAAQTVSKAATQPVNAIEPQAERTPQSTEKKIMPEENSESKITFKRREITDLIGDELSNDEIAEYFYYCLQRTDMLEEWRSAYSEGECDESTENA